MYEGTRWNKILTQVVDIRISAPSTKHGLPIDCTLQFLSHVDTLRIPLHLICGNRLDVWTTNAETETWFSNLLLSSNQAQDQGQEWWQSASLESPLGILAAVKVPDASKTPQPRITEILFYAARKTVQDLDPPSHNEASSSTPELGLYALPLSSDLLLFNDTDITPPASPVLGESEQNTANGRFIPRPWDEPTLRQRRKIALDSTFSAASDRRKRHSGASTSAAHNSPSLLPTLPRLKSEASRGSVPLLTRPKSRSPSIASLRRDPTIPEQKRAASGLSHATPAPAPSSESQLLAQKNKEMVSKVVLAGLRVWGFTASSKRKKRASTSTAAATPDPALLDAEEEAKDEEYKLLYHHVYKSTCFAFRATISKQDFSNGKEVADRVRDTVDALLLILCKDPMDIKEDAEMEVGQGGFKGAVVRTPKGELGEEERGLR
jgi:hypothetical protein